MESHIDSIYCVTLQCLANQSLLQEIENRDRQDCEVNREERGRPQSDQCDSFPEKGECSARTRSSNQIRSTSTSISPWSTMHVDLIGEILKFLPIDDQLKASLTNKNWFEAARRQKLKLNFPWLLSNEAFTLSTHSYGFYDPCKERSYWMVQPTENKRRYYFWNVKRTWILLQRVNNDEFLIFNPYSKQTIDVPSLLPSYEYPRPRQFQVSLGFCEDSNEFLVFFVDYIWGSGGGFYVRSWCSSGLINSVFVEEYKFKDVFMLVSTNVLFVIFKDGAVGQFNGVDWIIIVRAEQLTEEEKVLFTERGNHHTFIECQGIVYFVRNWFNENLEIYQLCIFEQKWIAFDMGASDKILFLGCCSRYTPVTRHSALMLESDYMTHNLAGRVYFCHPEHLDSGYFYHPLLGGDRFFNWPHNPNTFKLWIQTPDLMECLGGDAIIVAGGKE